MTEKVHIRMGGNLEHCGVEILPNGADIKFIVIDKIVFNEKEKVAGVERPAFVLYFKPNKYTKLPMLLNAKNKRTLQKLTGVDDYSLTSIKNFPVRMTKEQTRMGYGLRISKIPADAPTKKEVLSESHRNWGKVVTFLKSGGSISDIKTKYEFDLETEKKLKEWMQK